MALTRKGLAAMDISEECIDKIIAAHSETVSALKSERDEYKEKAEKYEAAEAEIEKLKADAKNHESTKAELEALKQEVADGKAKAEKEKAYRELLAEAGIAEKRIAVVLRASAPNLSTVEMKDGAIVDKEKHLESIKKEWSDFVTTSGKAGADTEKPPTGTGGTTMTKEQIMQIKDTKARQAAMLENKSLFPQLQ